MGTILNLLWQILYANGPISVVVNGQNLKQNRPNMVTLVDNNVSRDNI